MIRRLFAVLMVMLLAGVVQAKEWVEPLVRKMSVPRAAHTATLLKDGSVLIAGGMQADGVLLDTAELFNAKNESFATLAGAMTMERVGHTATLLSDGRVLIAGGWCATGPAETAELYNPETQTFAETGAMTIARAGFTATLLNDGRVLFVGGENADGGVNASAEIYDPATGEFKATGNMMVARSAHTATLLDDGRVLITGGSDGANILSNTEIYDPATGTFTAANEMTLARYKHGAIRLKDGRVLIVGGSDSRDWGGRYDRLEIYNPATGEFTAAGKLLHKRFKLENSLVLLDSGNVLIGGGGETMEIYMPREKASYASYDRLSEEYFFTSATLLEGGNVLITGGYDFGIESTSSAWMLRTH